MKGKAKRASLDRISTLPSTIIENILCLVPIKDAVRTSILSKEWRYIWTRIPKLVFNKDLLELTRIPFLVFNKKNKPADAYIYTQKTIDDFFYAIHQVLLLHQGPILEFTLSMCANNTRASEIDRILLHLARNNCNTIKKFTLDNCSYKLPLSIFSFHQLTDLYIRVCSFDYDSTFSVFSSLTSLYLQSEIISKKALLHLLSYCPLLKSLELVSGEEGCDEDISIVELFKCLPMIEHLNIQRFIIKCSQDSVPRELPTASVHLKYFILDDMCFFDKYVLRLLGLVIRSSPKLEKIKLDISDVPEHCEIKLVSLEDYSDIWLEHLKELEIVDFYNIEGELEFVKLILAKSPVLKKVIIRLRCSVHKNNELNMLRNLIRSPRISPFAEIIVQHGR